MFPAFKEWNVIVEALGAGEQILILRKGGISEGKGGFQMRSSKFWLYPTAFHAQLQKTKPAAHRWFRQDVPAAALSLRYFAETAKYAYLTDWDDVAALNGLHFWTEETIRERFNWSKEPGIHVFAVRIYALDQAIDVRVTPEMAGCKSWVEVPHPFDAAPSSSVLASDGFDRRLAAARF